jgi:serine protease Do
MHASMRRLLPVVLLILAASCTEPPSATPESVEVAVPGQPAPMPVVASAAGPAVAGALPNFSALVDSYGPAVVNVSTVTGASEVQGGRPELSPDDPLSEFFRGFGGPRGQAPPARGEGSGFVISADGYILTNAHVVEDAREVTVRMTDRREYRAQVVGMDQRTDVAVLKIDAKNLPVVRIGDASRLKPGEWVIAIGSPFGFDNTVTAGIVSAIARSLGNPDTYTPFIQTDVAVNPGNSGGPLFNMQGEVVGINSQIYSRTGGYQGVSFAIPIDVAVDVKNQLVATGRVQRGRIGVAIQEVNQALADSFELPRPRGALVSEVVEGGPAADAGLEPGDVILAVDGKAIERSSELPPLIAAIKPGAQATLAVWRNKSEKKMRVKVGELEDEPVVAARGGPTDSDTGRLGLAVRPLTGDERERLNTAGRLVVEDADGPAALAGVERGDVILAVNGAKVASVREYRSAVDAAGSTVALLVQRGNAKVFVPVRIDS